MPGTGDRGREFHAAVSQPEGMAAWIPFYAPGKGLLHDLSLIGYDWEQGNYLDFGGDVAGVIANGAFLALDTMLVGTALSTLERGAVRGLAEWGGREAIAQIGRDVTQLAWAGARGFGRGFAQRPQFGIAARTALGLDELLLRTENGILTGFNEVRAVRCMQVLESMYGQEAVLGARRELEAAGYVSYGELARIGRYRNNGFDDVFIKWAMDGSIEDIIVTESKWWSRGAFPELRMTSRGRQMSERWVDWTIERMQGFKPDGGTRWLGDLLRENQRLIHRRINVFDANTRVNHWNWIPLP